MGMGLAQCGILLSEHRYRPIEGELLTISRNTIGLTAAGVRALMAQMGVPMRPGVELAVDNTTVHPLGETGWVSDESFYAAFCSARLSVLDVSDYEKADIVHDMCKPVDASLEGRFDFIINGSCLDNIFDPVTALRNTARMLKPGGRLFQFEWGNSHPTAYLKYSPDWFHDYFAINEFADCKVYVFHPRWHHVNDSYSGLQQGGSVDLYQYDPVVVYSGQTGYECSHINSFRPQMVIVVAEKGERSTWDRSPIQMHYRTDEWHKKTCLESALRFRASPRPIFSTGAPDPQPEGKAFSNYQTMKLVTHWPGSPPPPPPAPPPAGLWRRALRKVLRRAAA